MPCWPISSPWPQGPRMKCGSLLVRETQDQVRFPLAEICRSYAFHGPLFLIERPNITSVKDAFRRLNTYKYMKLHTLCGRSLSWGGWPIWKQKCQYRASRKWGFRKCQTIFRTPVRLSWPIRAVPCACSVHVSEGRFHVSAPEPEGLACGRPSHVSCRAIRDRLVHKNRPRRAS